MTSNDEMLDDDYREIDREIRYLCGVVKRLEAEKTELVEALSRCNVFCVLPPYLDDMVKKLLQKHKDTK